jgi:hypothetical protein
MQSVPRKTQKQEGFSAAAISLSVTAATLYRCFACENAAGGMRALFWRGLLGAAALVILSAFACALERQNGLLCGNGGKGFWARAVQGTFLLWFGAEILRTALWAQTVCRQEFASGVLPGVLPLLLVCLAALGVRPAACSRAARMLWWLVALGALAALAGLAGQMHWENLMIGESGMVWADGSRSTELWLWPEYFALPLLAEGDPTAQRRAVWLPAWMFGVQVGFAFCAQLLFGAGVSGMGSGYTGFEVLRVWQLGMFSRLDALLLLVWLAAALYRICFLCLAMRKIWDIWNIGRNSTGNMAKEGTECENERE